MASEKLEKLKTNNIFKEWVWPLLVALSVALLIKWKLGDLYSIPTGSMEPTLHGRENGGDRVFCNKLAYYFRDKYQPKRYETMVFVCPWEGIHKGENYIKRCIGLPEESLIISNGDIYVMPYGAVKPKIAPKPLELQDSIWIPVYKSDFSKQSEDELRYYWTRSGNDGRWIFKDGKLVGNSLTASYLTYTPVVEEYHLGFIPDRHVKRQTVDFQCPECSSKLRKMVNSQQLTAFCPKCGTFLSEKDIIKDTFEHPGLFASDENPPRSSDYNAVSDLRLILNVKPLAKTGEFCAEFSSGVNTYLFTIPVGKGDVTLERNGRLVESSKFKLKEGKGYNLDFFRYDGFIFLRFGNKIILKYELPECRIPPSFSADSSGVSFAVKNGKFAIGSIELYRDFYYYTNTATRNASYDIPKDCFFALGDNQPTSSDSRFNGIVGRDKLVGPAIFVWWPLHRIHILK